MTRNRIAAPALTLALLVSTPWISSCATTPPESAPRTHAAHETGHRSQIATPISPGKSSAGTAGATAEENKLYRDALNLYTQNAFEAAQLKLQTLEKKYPQSALTSQIENLHGLCFLLTKKPAQAVPHFNRALEESQGNPATAQYLRYNLADALFESDQVDEAQKVATGILAEGMDKDNRTKVLYLRSRIASTKGQYALAAREALAAGKLITPDASSRSGASRETRNAIAAQLDTSLKSLNEVPALEDLYKSYEDSPLADSVLFRLGSVEMASGAPGARENGTVHLKLLQSRFPESSYYAQASELLHGAPAAPATPEGALASGAVNPLAPVPSPSAVPSGRDNGPVDSHAVGVLLPLKGKFGKFGARSLQGIELAFHIFNANEPDAKINLYVEDSGEEADTAVRALDKLVKQRHVVAVIGPLLSKGIDQVTARAEELGVPLVSLARHVGVQSDYIFQGGLTLRLQAREIARFAIEKLGLKRLAVMYPRDKVGEDAMQKFWDSTEALGGTIVGAESYNPGETDFRQAVDRLSGLYYTDARSRELEELAKKRTEEKIKKRTRKTEKYFSLPPIVDYEAVFIPEEPKVAGQILPTFAYRDVDKVKFLGTSAWNSPEFPARAGAYAENSYFLDAYFPDSTDPAAVSYAEHYRSTFNQEPTSMDALAHDAAKVLESVLTRHEGIGRESLRDRLKDVKNLPGVTGRISYQEGLFVRDLKILTVNRAGKIVEAVAP